MSEYEFIEYIKRKRLSLFITQTDLAKQIPISRTAYCKIECHKQELNFFILRRLADILKIDLNIIKSSSKCQQHHFD